MGFTILKLKVEDFEKWNCVFSKVMRESSASRIEANIKFRVFSTPDSRNEVWILAEFGDPVKFKAYMESPPVSSEEASAKAGILGTPEAFPLVHEFDE